MLLRFSMFRFLKATALSVLFVSKITSSLTFTASGLVAMLSIRVPLASCSSAVTSFSDIFASTLYHVSSFMHEDVFRKAVPLLLVLILDASYSFKPFTLRV